MANVVGDAYVMIHAITSGVDKDIKKGFSNVDKHGNDAGSRVGKSFNNGFSKNNRGGWFKKFKNESIAASKSFSSLTRAGYTIAPLFQALGGTIGVLGTSLVSLGSIIGAVTLPAITVLASGMMSLAQAAVTVKLAFAGVGKAISAGFKASKKNTDNAKQLAKAYRTLQRAQEALAKAGEDAAVSEARAKRDLKDAEDELHEARKQAMEDLQQLGFDSEDAAIAEQRAAIELEKARETLARVADLPPNSRARKEAELAFAEADLNYRRAIDKNNDLKEKEATNAAMGTGSLEDQVEGQKEVIAAVRARDDAEDNLGTTIKDNATNIKRLTEDRDDAEDAIADLKENKAAVDAYKDALAELSPEAQAFVKYIVSLKDVFKEFKAAAGKDLFPKLTTALKNFFSTDNIKLFKGLLQETGSVLGDVAIKFSKTVTSGENLKRLESIWKTNNKFLGKLGDAASNLYEVFLILLDAAKPLIDAFGDWLVKVTGAWKETLKAEEATGKLADKFKIAKDIFKDLGTIFGNTFKGFSNIFRENVGPGSGGQIFLNYFKDITDKFKNLKEIDGKPIKEFFAGAAENGTKLLDLLGKIFGAFFKMADDKSLGIFYDNLGKAVDIVAGIDLGGAMVAISELIIEFAKFIKLVTDSGSMEIFFGVLTDMMKGLNNFLKGELGQTILKTSAKILPFLAAFGLVAKVGGFAFKVVAGGLFRVGNVVTGVAKGFSKLVGFIKNIPMLFRAGMTIIADMAGALGLAVGPFLAIVAAVVAVIAILVGAYTQSEKFRKSIAELGQVIKEKIIENFNKIKKAINDVFGGGSGGANAMQNFKKILKSIGDWIAKYVMPYVKLLAGYLIDVLGGAITAVIYIIGALKEAFMFLWNFVSGIFKLLTGDFEGAGKSFKGAFGNLVEFVKDIFKAIYAVIEPAINLWKKLLGGAWDGLKSGLSAVWDAIKAVWNFIVGGIKLYIDTIKTLIGAVWNGLKNGLETAWNAAKAVWETIIGFVKGLKTRISSLTSGMWDGIKSAFLGAINYILGKWNSLQFSLKFPSSVFGIPLGPLSGKGFTLDTPDIPLIQLAEGGIVKPKSGGTMAVIGEAGKSERVEPLDADGLSVRDRAIIAELSGGGKSTTINMVVNPSAGMDERQLAAIVSRQIAFMSRRGAA